MEASSLLYGRLCVIIAITILLFLPLTFSGNNIVNIAYAQPTPWEDYRNGVEWYRMCLGMRQSNIEWNEMWAGTEHEVAVTECNPPKPPEPLQPLDCNEVQTCPISDCDPTRASCPEQSPLQSIGQNPQSGFKPRSWPECIGAFLVAAKSIKCEDELCGIRPTPEEGLGPNLRPFPKFWDDWFREACGLPRS